MGSKGTNTYTTNTQGPQWLQTAYMGALGQAQQAAAQPFQAYGGELVAPVNQQEQAGIGNVNQYAGWAQPWLNTAGTMAYNAAQPITQNQIASYANPFTQNVLGATEQEMALLNAQGQQSVIGNAISSNAWGGDRSAIAQAQLNEMQLRGEAPTIANIASQGYQTGITTAEQEQQQQAQGAYSLADIGQAAQTLGMAGAGAQIQAGQLEQGTQQQLDTAKLQQYYTAMGYPFQTAAYLAGIETELGGVSGGTSQTTAPAPNPLSSLLGIAAAGAGAYMGAKPAARGGGIYLPHRDDGGGIMPYSGGINFIPGVSGGRGGQGPPKPPIDPSFMLMYGNKGAAGGQGGTSGLGNIGMAAAKYFGKSGGISDPAGVDNPDSSYNQDILAGLPSSSERAIYGYGGGVLPEHAGLGFAGYADGGDPNVYDPSEPSPIDTSPGYNKWALSGQGRLSPDLGTPDINAGRGGVGLGAVADTSAPAPNTDVAQQPGRSLSYAGRPPPNIADPANTGVAGGRPSYTGPSYSEAATRPEDTRTFGQKIALPLMQAGFAMMASRSPFLGEAIGQGGLSGIGAYVQQEREKATREEQEQGIALKAKQLSDLADAKRREIQRQELGTGYRATPTGGEEPIPGGPADPEKQRRDVIAKGQHIVPYTDPTTGIPGFYNMLTGQIIYPPGPGGAASGAPAAPGGGGTQVASAEPGFYLNNSKLVETGQSYNYSQGAPHVEKGTPVPEPAEIAGTSSGAIKQAATSFLQTGKLPAGYAAPSGNSSIAVQKNLVVRAIHNYAAAEAASVGMTPQQVADIWQTSGRVGQFIVGQPGQATVALGTAMRHLDTLRDFSNAWNQAAISNDWRTVRSIQAKIATEFGSAAATNLETAAHIVGPEILKAIGVAGAGTAEERASYAKQFSAASGVDQINGAIDVTQKLMRGQLIGKQNQATALGISPERFKSLVGEHEYDRLREIDNPTGTTSTPASARPTASASPPVPANAADRETGKTYAGNNFRDGKARTWNGHGFDLAPAAP